MVLKLIQRIREEFEESPGLRVTIDEGARFWGLDAEVCEPILSEGVRTRLVRAFEAPDFVIASLEDIVAIGGALLIVSRF